MHMPTHRIVHIADTSDLELSVPSQHSSIPGVHDAALPQEPHEFTVSQATQLASGSHDGDQQAALTDDNATTGE